MLSKKEAFSFIQTNLEIIDAKGKLENDRKHLLDEIVTQIQCKIPFQNLTLLRKPYEERCRPDLCEIKTDFLAGIGGLCYFMNTSLHFLLKAIGFNSSIALSSVTSTRLFPSNHVVVYIEDLEKPGDKYIADVGTGFPTYRIVNLDFETESPVYRDSFLEYKYVKHDGKILRMHRKGCPLIAMGSHGEADFYIDGWRRFYWAESTGTQDLSKFDSYFDRVYTDPAVTNFHTAFRVQGCQYGRWIAVNRATLMMENEHGILEKSSIEGDEESLILTVQKYFPMLSRDLISEALRHLPTK